MSEETDRSLTKKYLGTDLYQISFPDPIVDDLLLYNVALSSGYNFFYFLSGELIIDTLDTNYSLALSSANLELSATAGSSIDVADVIWQRQGASIEGAWLKSFENEPRDVTMRARINPGQTSFRFPFPGKGLSSIELGWTGHSIENVSRDVWYTENTQNLKDILSKLYWNTTPSNSSCDSIDIHQTNLIDSGAYADKNSQNADRIYTRPVIRDDLNDGIYNGSQRTDFLFKFDTIQLPISPGENKIYFPLVRLSKVSDDNDTKPLFQMNIDQCDPIALKDIDMTKDMAGAVASLDITTSDMIFKKTGYCGGINEAAWLSGAPITMRDITNSSQQGGLYNVFNPGIETRFVFHLEYGNNLTPGDVFYGLAHDPWCDYLNLKHVDYLKNSDRTGNLNYSQFEKCNCKAVWNSPCGHSEDFLTFWKFTDILYLDPTSGFGDLNSFSPEAWRDREENPWNQSNQFAWFDYEGIEPSVGWGIGTWKTGNGEPFTFTEGEVYVYRRTDINSCGTTPPLILNRTIEESLCSPREKNVPIWAKAIFVNGEFINAGIPSEMILYPTDYIVYDHKESCDFLLTMTSSTNVTSIAVSSVSSTELVPLSSLGGLGSQLVSNTIITETEYPVVTVESTILSSVVTHTAPNFLWTTSLEKYNPRPYWATDNVEFCVDGQSTLTTYDDYINTTIPAPSNLILTYDSYFSYQYQGTIPFVWNENLTMRINENKPPQWLKIITNSHSLDTWENITNQKSKLKHSSVWDAPSTNKFIKFSATDIPSSMILESHHNCGFWSEIIYCAQEPFTWTVSLSSNIIYNTTPTISLHLTADAPWKNTKNIYDVKYKIHDGTTKRKTKKSLGVFLPDKTSQDILRGKDLTIEYDPR